jgi:glycosyltransferase involved in cell wall biosynthesis
MNKRPVFVIGYPGDVGGANTECWHTLRLWRSHGLPVSCIPTWQPDERWRARLEAIGCRTIVAGPEELPGVSGLAGSVVVSFCNSHFLQAADRFRDLGCKAVWVGCMTWLLAEERKLYRRRGPLDGYVFQSRYQEEELLGQLAKFGVDPGRCFLIRGPLDCQAFPFRPLAHLRRSPLVVGRISRAAEDKFSAATWPIYRRIPHPIRARIMAWDESVARKLGPPPPWAECLPAQAETPQEFFSKLHCMLQVNGQAEENWPRSGLEAMASGVPIVAQNRWGWKEMIRHGETGLLADSADELAYAAARLAYDEDFRLQIAHRARRALEEELADPAAIWSGWQRLFERMRDEG